MIIFNYYSSEIYFKIVAKEQSFRHCSFATEKAAEQFPSGDVFVVEIVVPEPSQYFVTVIEHPSIILTFFEKDFPTDAKEKTQLYNSINVKKNFLIIIILMPHL